MANTFCSLNIHCIFSTKERAPMLALSVSVSQLPETIDYIKNQVEHHRTRTFEEEYLAFLKRHEHSTRCRLLMPGLSFDDKYLWD
jgi:putative transposase